MNQGIDEPSLACVIERIAELMQALVHFALSPWMERHLERLGLTRLDGHPSSGVYPRKDVRSW